MVMTPGWVYFFGTDDGKTVLVGWTCGTLAERRRWFETCGTMVASGLWAMQGQPASAGLRLLAAVQGSRSDEKNVQDYFAPSRVGGSGGEVFRATPELVEYVNWLRQQWWTAFTEDEDMETVPDSREWMPGPDRRIPFTEDDPSVLLQYHRDYTGPLANTPWDRLCTPAQTGDDFYTPVPLVDAAREAMGGIDLDPASHWQANRVHKIPVYYHVHRSAFENPWKGRVWLNPPYGDNAPWLQEIIRYWDSGDITQLCMLSPVWVFTAAQARPVVLRSSAMILLSPTPTFWGHPKGRTGTNHPHMILYMGSRVVEFHRAFGGAGIPFRLLL